MKLISSYRVKIKHYNYIFKDTISLYRRAVDFFLTVALEHWDELSQEKGAKARLSMMERLTIKTKENPEPIHDFGKDFYKFPSLLRRAAINEANGKVSSYKSNLANWEDDPKGKAPSLQKAGYTYPALYRGNMFRQTGTYHAQLKVWVRNTWDWIDVELRKSDMDYIQHHCKGRTACVPTLRKRGKEWYMDFVFTETQTLNDTGIHERRILTVDLGVNSPCVCSVMDSRGTIYGRHFCKLPKETDSLQHAINRIKKAQQHGAGKMPRLWERAKGINQDIAVKTAAFIIDIAILYNTDVIVFEHLELNGKKRGSKKQKLHLWKACSIQRMVTDKAHRLAMRISHVNAWNTSALAFDGSGSVERGTYRQDGKEKYNYSICVFPNGKTYHCDLNASYNIGARYFIREILKSLPERERLVIEAKVPQCTKRSTCTLSTLISLNAELTA